MSTLDNKTILLVDDEKDLRELLEMALSMHGCNILQASNGKSAFEIVNNNQIDAVISDIKMPGGDGVGLLEDIRAKYPSIPLVVLVTGFADISESEAIKKGAIRLLHKPVDFDAITDLLTEHLK